MPSYRVTDPTLPLEAFDVIGQDGEGAGFIGHVGLSELAGSYSAAKIPIFDMGPPLHGQGNVGSISAHAIGSSSLTDDEAQKIKVFIDRHSGEHQQFSVMSRRQLIESSPRMYCILPHATPATEEDGRYARMRFSCAGFVLEAYKKARIQIVNLDALPPVEIEDIRLAYPRLLTLIESFGVSLEDLGLVGDGPWPVLLCGYLFHSFNRPAEDIRRESYSPSIEDRFFH